jgi:phosphate starvation-inducible PhoH-like protein
MRLKPVAIEPGDVVSRTLSFGDNGRCAVLFGRHQEHLALLEQHLPVSLAARGNLVTISGEVEAVDTAAAVLEDLYRRLEGGLDLSRNEIVRRAMMVRAG